MTRDEKLNHLKNLIWDYNIKSEEILDVLEGSLEKAGHLNKDKIFCRMLSSLPWHIIVELMGIEDVKKLLTTEVISQLWPHSLREQYDRIRKVLHGEFVPPAEWGTAEARKYTFPVLSDRWYGPRAGIHRA